MSIIKRVLSFGIVLPIVLAFLNYRFSSIKSFEWGHDRINEISILAFSIAIISCIFITIANARSIKRKLWYILPSIFAVIFLLYIYTIYSLSSFGF